MIYRGGMILALGAALVLSGCGAREDVGADISDTSPAPGSQPVATQQVGEANPEWFECEADGECVPVAGVCDSWNAVNKVHEDHFFGYVEQANAALKCSQVVGAAGPQPEVSCQQNRCAVLEDPAPQSGATGPEPAAYSGGKHRRRRSE